jgi:iron complex outermembrane receptor protein
MRSVATTTAGLTITSANSRSNGINIYMRGQGQNDTTSIFDQSVAVYMDGVYIARGNGGNIALYDLDHVEVLRGPQGTLYGRNSTGGAVSFFTRMPKLGDFGGYVRGTYGSYDLKEIEAAVTVPVTDRLGVRFAGLRRDRPHSWQKVVNQGVYSDTADVWSGRVNIVWKPFDSVTAQTSAYRMKDESTPAAPVLTGVNICGQPPAVTGPVVGPTTADCLIGPTGNPRSGATTPGALGLALLAGPDPRRVNLDLIPQNVTSIYGVTQSVAVDIDDDNQVKYIGSYRHLLDRTLYDQDAIANAATSSNGRFDVRGYQMTHEAQVTGKAFDRRLTYAAGFYWLKESVRETTASYTLGQINAATSPSLFDDQIRNESQSVYAQATYRLIDPLRVTLGGRYTWDQRGVRQFNRNRLGCTLRDSNNALLPANLCDRQLQKDYRNFSYNVTVDYDIGPKTLVYLAHRRGYRSGGINARGNFLAEVQPTKPEIVRDLEGGIKSDFHIGGMTARLNADGYYQWYKDLQRSISFLVSPTVTGTYVGNAEGAHIYGGELEFTLIPVRDLELSATAAHVHARYTGFTRTVLVAGAPVVQDLSNNRFYGTPAWSFHGAVHYVYRPDWLPTDTVSFDLDSGYQSKIFTGILNSEAGSQKAYWLFNARVGFNNIARSRVDLALWMKNIGDKTYKQGGYSDFMYNVGYNTSSFAPPRTIGATLTFKFGDE